MFELYQLLDNCEHIAHAIVQGESIIFASNEIKIELITLSDNIYNVYENDDFKGVMTEAQIIEKYINRNDGD